MITSEKAFDLLPVMTDVFDKLNLKEYISDLQKNSKGKDKEAVGMEVFKYVLKNSSKIKEEFFSIVAVIQDKTPEEIKKQNIIETFNSCKKLFTEKEFMSFFSSAMKWDMKTL